MLEWLSTQKPILAYAFLFLNAFFESLFPPYPSDGFVLVFSFLAGRGAYHILFVYLFTVLGSIAGIMVIYYLGKAKGDALIQLLSQTFLGKIFSVKLIERAKEKFTQRGDLFVLLNRFLPGMRAPICFAAGMVKISRHKMFWYSLVSVLVWNLFLVLVGFYVGKTWDEAAKFLRNYNIIVTITLIIGLIIFTVIYFKKRAVKIF